VQAKLRRYGRLLSLVAGIGLFCWLFPNIALYGLLALLLALLLRPVMEWLENRRLGNWYLPKPLCAVLTLAALLLLVVGIVWLFVPLIAEEASLLTQTDPDRVLSHYEDYGRSLEALAQEYYIPFSTDSVKNSLLQYRDELIPQPQEVVKVAGGLFTLAGKVAFGVFTVLFFVFFLLMDNKLVPRWLVRLTPSEYTRSVVRIYNRVKLMLRRYFAGLLLQFAVFATLVFIGLSLLGVENAFFIAVIAGILNWIPYIGPLAGMAVGLFITALGNLTASPDNLGLLAVEIIGVIGVVQLTDALVFQPTIFASSVRAHPLEVFIVILMASQLGGIPFMVLAVPAYTVLRIVAVEFAPRNLVVAKLTEEMRESLEESERNGE
jgi:predicted PurR-regulated permease PerM